MEEEKEEEPEKETADQSTNLPVCNHHDHFLPPAPYALPTVVPESQRRTPLHTPPYMQREEVRRSKRQAKLTAVDSDSDSAVEMLADKVCTRHRHTSPRPIKTNRH